MPKTLNEQGEQLRLSMEMFDFGVAVMRENLRRRRPSATEVELDEALDRWMQRRDEGELPGDLVLVVER